MNIEAEKGLLNGLINVRDFATTIPFKLTKEDFFDECNQIVAEVILKLIENGQNTFSKKAIKATANELNLTEFLPLTNDGKFLDELIKNPVSEDEALLFLKQVKKESIKHHAVEKLRDVAKYVNTTQDTLTDIITRVEDVVFGMTSASDFQENKIIDLTQNIDKFIDNIGEHPGENGLDIGLPGWQRRVGGLASGRVHMFIATFKTGKSAFGQRAALLQSRHLPTLIVDTEMDVEAQQLRLFCMLTKIPYSIMEDGYWKIEGHQHYNQYFHVIQQGKTEFKKLNISYLSAVGKSVNDMVPAMRRWVIENRAHSDGKKPRGLIVYDYLKLTSASELAKIDIKEYQQLGLETIALKNFANKYKVPIITFGQTNREDDMTANCLGASKRIADNVDSLTLFKEKTPEILTKDPNGSHLLRVFAARFGPGTKYGEHISLDFDKSVGHMAEVGFYAPSNNAQQVIKNNMGFKKSHDATTEELLDAND